MLPRYLYLKGRPSLYGSLLLFMLSSLYIYGQQENVTVQAKTKEDSVLFYINESKNNSLTDAQKRRLIGKGLNYAYKVKNDSLRSKQLSMLSYTYYQLGDSILFRKTNADARLLAKKIKDSVVLAEAYWDLGTFFQINSVRDSAYYSFSQAQKIYEAKNNAFLSGRMLINMANQQEAVKDYVGSESNTIMAIERLKPLDKFRYLYFSYNNLGVVAKDLGEYDKAIDYYKEALFYANKMEDKAAATIEILNNSGVVYQDKEAYPEAIKIFADVLASDSIQFKNPELYSKTLNNLAFCKIKLNDTLGTYGLIEESIKIKDNINLKDELATSYATLAQYYTYRKDTLPAIAAATRSKLLAKESNNNERLMQTLAFLIKIDLKNASEHGEAYIALNDSLQKEERQARNKFARIRFETDEFIAENVVLSEEKEVLSKENQILAAVALGIFLLGLAVYIIVDQRSKNQKLRFQQQQQYNNQEIFNLMLAQKQKVDEVKRMEQKRISEELHDGVLGKMLGARMVLTGLNKKADTDAIIERSEAIAALKNIENELRSISHELSHTAYQKINNFINSIDALLESTKEKASIKTLFTYNEDEDWDSLMGDIKINVYRIIQENLQNAIKHSGCSNFFINFEKDEEFFLITIGDDGKGFSFEKERKGIGIRNISSRVQKMKGTWSIDTAPDEGTVMKLRIPVQHSTMHLSDTKYTV